jgi:hypothetical protein
MDPQNYWPPKIVDPQNELTPKLNDLYKKMIPKYVLPQQSKPKLFTPNNEWLFNNDWPPKLNHPKN